MSTTLLHQCCGSVSFGQPDPFHETDPDTDPGSNKLSKMFPKINQNHKNIILFFFKNIKLMLNGHEYLPHK